MASDERANSPATTIRDARISARLLVDNPTEAFRFRLPLRLRKGAHSLAVRTVDEAENMGVTQVTFVR